MQGDINAKAEIIAKNEEAIETYKQTVATNEQTIAEQTQQITDLNATIEEMKNEPGNAGVASPANNGTGADALHQASGAPQWDPTLSATENKARMEAYEAELKKHMH